MLVKDLNNNSPQAQRLDFFVDRKTEADVGEAILNGAVSHSKRNSEPVRGRPEPSKVASGHLCISETPEICQ